MKQEDLPIGEAKCAEWDREALDQLLEKISAKEKAKRIAELES